MTDEEKKVVDELLKQVLAGLIQDIERAKKENQETRKMQDFVIKRIAVEISFKGRLPHPDWVNEGIDHYITLGIRISRNDVLTGLTEKMTRFREIKDPKKIEEIIEKYKEHEKEIRNLIKPHIIEVTKPRF